MAAFEDYKSKRIFVHRNGDVFSSGKKFVVSLRIYRNYEQFLHGLSDEIQLLNGAVRKVFTLDGVLVTDLEHLQDNGIYVASGGEQFKNVAYRLGNNTNSDTAAQEKVLSKKEFWRRVRNGRIQKLGENGGEQEEVEKPIFTQTSKGYRVTLFTNGEFLDHGKRWILNHRNAKTFDELLHNLSDFIKLPNGAAQRLYDAETYKKIQRLSHLRDGQNIVAVAASDTFKRGPYMIMQSTVPSRADSIKASETPKENLELPRSILLYPNGDAYHTGFMVPVTSYRFPDLKKLINFLNKEIRLPVKIHKLFTTSGKLIKSVEDLQNGGGYVMVPGADAFIPVKYNINSRLVRQNSSGYGLQGSTQYNDLMQHIRYPSTSSRGREPSVGGNPSRQREGSTTSEKDPNVIVPKKTARPIRQPQQPAAKKEETLITNYSPADFAGPKSKSQPARSTQKANTTKPATVEEKGQTQEKRSHEKESSNGLLTGRHAKSHGSLRTLRNKDEIEEDETARVAGGEEVYGAQNEGELKQFTSKAGTEKKVEKVVGPARKKESTADVTSAPIVQKEAKPNNSKSEEKLKSQEKLVKQEAAPESKKESTPVKQEPAVAAKKETTTMKQEVKAETKKEEPLKQDPVAEIKKDVTSSKHEPALEIQNGESSQVNVAEQVKSPQQKRKADKPKKVEETKKEETRATPDPAAEVKQNEPEEVKISEVVKSPKQKRRAEKAEQVDEIKMEEKRSTEEPITEVKNEKHESAEETEKEETRAVEEPAAEVKKDEPAVVAVSEVVKSPKQKQKRRAEVQEPSAQPVQQNAVEAEIPKEEIAKQTETPIVSEASVKPKSVVTSPVSSPKLSRAANSDKAPTPKSISPAASPKLSRAAEIAKETAKESISPVASPKLSRANAKLSQEEPATEYKLEPSETVVGDIENVPRTDLELTAMTPVQPTENAATQQENTQDINAFS